MSHRDRQPPKPDTPRGVEPRLRRGPAGHWMWRFRVRWSHPADGRRLVDEFDTIEAALDFKARLRLAGRRGGLEDLTRGDIDLTNFVKNEWWPKDAGRNLERNTLYTYKPVWNRHLRPRVGHLQLRQITPPVVQRLREEMEADGVGAPTIRRAMAILQAICRYAVAKGEMTTNPVKEVRKPPIRRQLAIVAISPVQVERLRDELATPASRALVSLIAYEGFRPEEALALMDSHVRRATLLIEQKNVDGRLISGQKRRRASGRDSRSPELWSPVRADLAAYRLATQADRPTNCALLFPRRDGQPWRDHDYRNWRRRVFKPAVERTDLPITRPYDLRHACASLMIHAGKPLNEVADHMGHTVATLSNNYAHLIADLKGQPIVSVPDAILAARAKRQQQAR